MTARNAIRYKNLHSLVRKVTKGHKRSLKGHQRSTIKNIIQRPDFLHVYSHFHKKLHGAIKFNTQGHWRSKKGKKSNSLVV